MRITTKRLLALILALVMTVGSITVFANEGTVASQPLPFDDVAATAWYYPHVRTVWENNLFHGTAHNTFTPHGTMTRAMFVQVLANIEKVNLSEYRTLAPVFEDTADSTLWYFAAVQWAAVHGISHNSNPNVFEPNRAISREEMAVMLYNYIVSREIEIPKNQEHNTDTTTPFIDQAYISAWATNAVRAIQNAGIITGYPDGNFQPNNQSTRAEVATIFAKYLQVLSAIAEIEELHGDYDENEDYEDEQETKYLTLSIANITGQGNLNGTVTIVNHNVATYDFPTGTRVTVRATAASGYVFDGWFSNADGTGTEVSRNSNHTFTITADTNLFARFRAAPQDTDNDGNGGNGNGSTWTPPPAAFVAVTSITKSSPLTITAGTPLALSATTNPANATNRNIIWSIQNAGATGATIIGGNTLNTTAAGTVTVRAAVANGATATTNFTQDFTITVTAAPPAFIPVTNITGVPATATIAPSSTAISPPLALPNLASPATATNRNITWSVYNAGGTGATISGNMLSADFAGLITVRATITNGATATTNFTQDFNIDVEQATGVAGITINSADPTFILPHTGGPVNLEFMFNAPTNVWSFGAFLNGAGFPMYVVGDNLLSQVDPITGIINITMHFPANTGTNARVYTIIANLGSPVNQIWHLTHDGAGSPFMVTVEAP